MENKKLTIVTVTFNAEKSLKRTIRSVLKQTYTDYEYLIIDGGSTDGTIGIIERCRQLFEKKGITFKYISEKDNGIYDAMNKGIRLASEDSGWINFLNADDCYRDVSVLEDVFLKTDISDADCIYGDTIIRRENGQKYRKKASEIDTIKYKLPFVHQALFVRTDLLRTHKFDTGRKLAADYDQWVRLFKEGCRFKRIDRDIVVFDASGTTGKRFKEYTEEALGIQKEYGLTSEYKLKRFIRNRIIPVVKENKLIYYLYARGNS
ncbi:MAG: glycosyltransferase [Lachnospiraceae bacterium]|nr:glycosyltransferase [Lachnospiraceae bacterium]